VEFWQNLFNGQGFMPRRACGLWDDSLIRLHVVSDAVIWLSYLWIPLVMLGSYCAQRKTLRLHKPMLWIFLLYIVFITACGWTHFFDALMFYNPVYRVNGLVRAVTAVVSFATAVSLIRLVPQAITAPVTILTQKAALHQQHVWLRDILDSATDGILKLCETRAELPEPLGQEPAMIEVTEASGLRPGRLLAQNLAQTAGFDRSRTDDLLTAVNEATMNALVHAGSATVSGYSAADRVQVWVEDRGPGIPLDRLPVSTLKQGYSTAGSAGQGWYMILSFVDGTYLLTGPEGTVVVLEMSRVSSRRAVPFSAMVGGDVSW
jgi:anti-sigma regulatory factor (Ser/Thr protein kinase)